jgi:hypothetical protein
MREERFVTPARRYTPDLSQRDSIRGRGPGGPAWTREAVLDSGLRQNDDFGDFRIMLPGAADLP